MKKNLIVYTITLLLITLLLFNSLALLSPELGYAQGSNVTFTTGSTMGFTSTITMTFQPETMSFKFGTGIVIVFIEFPGIPPPPDGVLMPCDWIQIIRPPGYVPQPCSWWEVFDPLTGKPLGEIHIDNLPGPPGTVHIDTVWPGPIILPAPGLQIKAEMKIPKVEPCDTFVVHEPTHWWPSPCTWWMFIDPDTGETYDFHVDWTNESCEFHVDKIFPRPFMPAFPVYELEAYSIPMIDEIHNCNWFEILQPQGFTPTPCSWWEILDPSGVPTGSEFHVDASGGGKFHVDHVTPDPIIIPWGPATTLTVREKISSISQCQWFTVRLGDPLPESGSWWRVINPDIGDVEFYIDIVNQDGSFHVDTAIPVGVFDPPVYMVTAERKIEHIVPCDWFTIVPPSPLPGSGSWWSIVTPVEWAGVRFYVDTNDGISRFHVDQLQGQITPITPPPYSVTAEPYTPQGPSWYFKPPYPDYVPSGMPDFDERQSKWTNINGWSYCGPVAVANSIWWLDSEFEKNTIPPPAYSDSFNLVTSYDTTLPKWDDHDPQNVPYLIEHLAYLMDTDSQRTKQANLDTNVFDMQTGITQYLSWTGVNPKGDCNGDGIVTIEDAWIVGNATGKTPGMAGWDMRADIDPVTTGWPNRVNADNDVDMFDMMLVAANMGNKGIFYEHTVPRPDFYYIEEEVEKCQDVVLCLGFYIEYSPGQFYREFGHFVTVAGINSDTQEIAISNPIRDDFEAGLAPGRSPVPHTHTPPPEPPYITHNNASLVSQDIFIANFYPCPGGDWELLGYPGYDPADGWHVQIEYAVITSPSGVHDVAVIDVKPKTPGKTQAYQGLDFKVNVTVQNQGDFSETFNVTLYANTTEIGKQAVTLANGTTQSIIFVWTVPSNFTKGNYTLSATADTVSGEFDTLDNTFTDGIITVNMAVDLNGDKVCDLLDLVKVAGRFGEMIGDDGYIANYDVNCDGVIELLDLVKVAMWFGNEDP